jgi:hypothetical protein
VIVAERDQTFRAEPVDHPRDLVMAGMLVIEQPRGVYETDLEYVKGVLASTGRSRVDA